MCLKTSENEERFTQNNSVFNTPKCDFGWQIAEALEAIQRAAFEHGCKVDIDIKQDKIIIEFREE